MLQVAIRGRRVLSDDGDSVVVEAGAGEPWDPLVRWTLAQRAFGLENLALIPGTAGAAPIRTSAPTASSSPPPSCRSMRSTSRAAGREPSMPPSVRSATATACSRGPGAARWLVVAVRWRLSRTPRLALDYGDIRDELARAGGRRADAGRRRRRGRRDPASPRLPDPATLGNAGSFFKNPLVAPAVADALRAVEPGLPAWPAGERVKLSAAWMIERCGWKGRRDGDAGVHASHALVLVNHGSATGAQLLDLARRIRDSVRVRFGVELEPEPVLAGPATL